MGDRALIQLVRSGGYSPKGSDAENIIKRTKLRMGGRSTDIEYAFARLVQIAIDGDTGNANFGVINTSGVMQGEEDSPGDNGCFVVDLDADWKIRRFG